MKPDYPKVSIKKGREWHLRRGHPWLFSGGISQAPKRIDPGQVVTLLDCDGHYVATGYYNPNCDIAVRVLSLDAQQSINHELLANRLQRAWDLRRQAIDFKRTNVFRLVNAEGDFLPGFILDYYNGVVVIQCHTAGADALLEDLVGAVNSVVSPSTIVVRNDASVRQREGLQIEAPKIIKGEITGEVIVKENDLSFSVDPIGGQKTGFFTDQRDKRAAIAQYASRLPDGAKLLNCFSYTCSFSIYATAANHSLSTVNVDQSEAALEAGKKGFSLNELSAEKHEFFTMDAFAFMDRQIATHTKYDITILDPPAFAKSIKDKSKALKAYARMTTLGSQLVKDGGLLVLCSCSGAISLDEFTESVRQGFGNSGKSVQMLETFQHGADHPVNLMAPEGAYLKVLFCRVTD